MACAMALVAIACHAVKANPSPTTIVQSDGHPLTIVLHGDEHAHYTSTTDGVLLASDGAVWCIASVDADGELVSTHIVAHNAGQRTQQELAAIASQQRERFHRSYNAKAMRRAETIAPTVGNYFPHTGSPRAVVILAEFSDEKFKHDSLTTHEIFDQYLNSADRPRHDADVSLGYNTGSVAQYFSAISYGQFTPRFDVFGPVSLPGTMASYGKTEDISRLMKDALEALDPETDFADYDQNGDGEVDLVYIIYAGYGENYSGNSADCIWPKASTLSNISYKGLKVVRYGVHCEMGGAKGASDRLNGIGLFCHEFSHTMGLPDLYTNASPADDLAMEDWDLMDGGEYLGMNIGTAPCEYSAWEREVMGWRMMETLTEPGRYELRRLSEEGGTAYRIGFGDRDHEYIYLENVQRIGWNRSIRGHGMIAVHVRYTSDVVTSGDHPNNSPTSTRRVTLVPADGLLYSSYTANSRIEQHPDQREEITAEYLESYRCDPFPGNLNVTAIGGDAEVRFTTFDGELTIDQPIFDITEQGGVVAFTFVEDAVPSGITEHGDSSAGASSKRVCDLQGRLVAPSASSAYTNSLRKGIYIIGNKKVYMP